MGRRSGFGIMVGEMGLAMGGLELLFFSQSQKRLPIGQGKKQGNFYGFFYPLTPKNMYFLVVVWA